MGGSIVGRNSGVSSNDTADFPPNRALRSDDPPNLVVRRRDEIGSENPIQLNEDRRRPRMRAVIADVHAVTRHGMRALLGLCGNVEVVSEASTAAELIRSVVEQAADLAVVDLNVSDGGGIQATKRIRHEAPFTKVLILSASDSEQDVIAAIQAGASGYLSKSASPAEFRSAIDTLRSGGTYLDAGAAKTIRTALDRPVVSKGRRRPRLGELTEREVEIARLMSEGLTARRIASRLDISDRTVNSHMGNLYRRLGVNNRVDAVRELMRLGITPSPF